MVSIQKEFNKIDRRFDAVDKGFDKLEGRLNKLEGRLDRLERRIIAIEDILTEHGKELKIIKADLKELRKQREVNREQLLDLEKRVKKLELKLETN